MLLFDYNFRRYNIRMVLYMVALSVIGILAIWSATNQSESAVKKQIMGIAIGLFLAAVLSLMVLPGGAVRFLDVDDARVSLAADTLAALGVVGGTGDGKFSPEGHLTRAQLCVMLSRVLNVTWVGSSRFDDVAQDAWYAGAVDLAQAVEEGGPQ